MIGEIGPEGNSILQSGTGWATFADAGIGLGRFQHECSEEGWLFEMRVFKDFKEVEAAVGTEVGVSDWIEVTQERIDQFAEATGDEQWIHVDVERAARELPGRTTIAHGLLTLSLAPLFVRSVMGVKGIKNTLNYGANRIRYLSPVPAGSKLRGRISIAEADEMPSNGLRVTYGITIEIEGGKRPACVAEMIAVHYQ